MPTYDYECKSCHHAWEAFQSIKAPAIKKCPECGKNQARRIIGPGAGILFKGSGFYITDYRSEGYKKAAAAAEGKSGGESKPEGAKPAKPESSSGKSESKGKPKAE
jgi:putative FmdB family regulatory protein